MNESQIELVLKLYSRFVILFACILSHTDSTHLQISTNTQNIHIHPCTHNNYSRICTHACTYIHTCRHTYLHERSLAKHIFYIKEQSRFRITLVRPVSFNVDEVFFIIVKLPTQ